MVRQAKPKKLLVIADGPRPHVPGESKKCEEARSIIDSDVDWECEIIKNYSNENLGCGLRPASGIQWAFDQVEEAIVLEDDCVPNPTFFRFCEELLDQYRNDPRIFHISGTNYQLGKKRTRYSYYFSRHPHCWGWASWRRAWKSYDFQMEKWLELRNTTWLEELHQSKAIANYWRTKFDKVIENPNLDVWDYQLALNCWINNGLSIIPNQNLISNVGFNKEATHTSSEKSPYARMLTQPIKFPLQHPNFIECNQ
ncbi:MAG TPA: glycosyltransferase family 2 protein, partial [Phormidium sp.]